MNKINFTAQLHSFALSKMEAYTDAQPPSPFAEKDTDTAPPSPRREESKAEAIESQSSIELDSVERKERSDGDDISDDDTPRDLSAMRTAERVASMVKRGRVSDLLALMSDNNRSYKLHVAHDLALAEAIRGGLSGLQFLCYLMPSATGVYDGESPFGGTAVCKAVNAMCIQPEPLQNASGSFVFECDHCSFDSKCDREVTPKRVRGSCFDQKYQHVHRSCLYRHAFALLILHAQLPTQERANTFSLFSTNLKHFARFLAQASADEPVYPESNCFEILENNHNLSFADLCVKERAPYLQLALVLWQSLREVMGQKAFFYLPERGFYRFFIGDPNSPGTTYSHSMIADKYCVRAIQGDPRSPLVLDLVECITTFSKWRVLEEPSYPNNVHHAYAGEHPFYPNREFIHLSSTGAPRK
jgi:hypothetical protein